MTSGYYVLFNFFECTLVNIKSYYSGGCIYLDSSNLRTNISKICASSCFLTYEHSSALGTFCYLKSNSNNLIKLEYTSFSQSGTLNSATGIIYITKGEHFLNSLNFSHNLAHTSSIGYFYPTLSSIYQYNNFVNSSSYLNYGINFHYSGYQFDLDFSNFINNNFKQYGIFFQGCGTQYKLFIKYCIFLYNNVSSHLFYTQHTQYQTIRSCYIILLGSGVLEYYFINENCIVTTGVTSTYILTHYSTYFCKTPNELGVLQINQEPCQTHPPIQTSCLIFTNNEQISLTFLSNLFYIFIIHIFFI